MADIPLPTFTDTVDQAWFIEPTSGPVPPRNYLDRFPEEVYNKSPDSHLVRFMYAMLGPAGIGWLRKNLLDARLQLEAFGLDTFDIERFYGDPFRFGRILDELYDEDPTGVFDRDTWDRIKARDEAYRTRATKFMQAARFGNAPQGMELVGESALGHAVDVVENYRYLFDVNSDQPLGLKYYGKTASTNEFIVRPKPIVSRSEIQTITINGNPTGGNFILTFNGQSTTNYSFTPLTSTTSAVTLPVATIPVTNTSGFPASGTVTVGSQTVAYTGVTGNSFTGCTGGVGAQPAGTIAVAPTPLTYSNIPYNATAQQVTAALTSLKNIGATGCAVRGGPIPNPYTVLFGGPLSNMDVPEITAVHALTGGASPSITITTATGGIDAASEIVQITPEGSHNLQTALDYMRPVPTIPSVFQSNGMHSRQDWNAVAASSQYSEVVRFVTGSTAVNWPSDSLHWISAGVEKQAPKIKNDRQQHYVGFHNVTAVTAYTDGALSDPNYSTNSSVLSTYRSEHAGSYSIQIKTAIPFFRSVPEAVVSTADRVLADYAEPLVVTTQSGDTGLINGVYPADYASVQGVPAIRYKDEQFWSSLERTSGADLIELDLGRVQAVNYLALEILRKPYDIEISYDTLDQSPRRNFVTVTPDPLSIWESSFFYDPLEQNPWQFSEYHFTDSLGQIIFTRFLRIKLTRRTGSFLFDSLNQVQTPWSVELRNLRIGRNVVDA
jgi:hypothetical protein